MRTITAILSTLLLFSTPCIAGVQKPSLPVFVVVDNEADDAQKAIDSLRKSLSAKEKISASAVANEKEVLRLKGVISAKNAAIEQAIKATENNAKLKADLSAVVKASEELKLENGRLKVKAARMVEPVTDETNSLTSFADQIADQGKEIALLKQQLAANFAVARTLGERIAKMEAPQGTQSSQPVQDTQGFYEQALKDGEDVFLAGVSKTRMAKLPSGQIVFKVPLEMAEKAQKVLGMGILSWSKGNNGVYFVTAGGSVKRN
jgi:hypothetical protein